MVVDHKYGTNHLDNIYDHKNWEDVLNDFQGKINAQLRSVPFQDREDLEQEIKIKIIEKMNGFVESNHTPGFWEFIAEQDKYYS